jgi:hypothetical protein
MATLVSPNPYDVFCSVKDSPRQMNLPDALIGRFVDGPLEAPVRPSRRSRARSRITA